MTTEVEPSTNQLDFSEIQAELAIKEILPNLPNSVKIKSFLNISKFKIKYFKI